MESLPKTTLFGKVKSKYVIIHILKNVRYIRTLQFLWNLNKRGREFLLKEKKDIDNVFANEGLIVYTFSITQDNILDVYSSYEKLYLQTIKRLSDQRKITLNIFGLSDQVFHFLNVIDESNEVNCEIIINRVGHYSNKGYDNALLVQKLIKHRVKSFENPDVGLLLENQRELGKFLTKLKITKELRNLDLLHFQKLRKLSVEINFSEIKEFIQYLCLYFTGIQIKNLELIFYKESVTYNLGLQNIEFAPDKMPKSVEVHGHLDYFDEIFQQLSSLNKVRKTIRFHSVSFKLQNSEYLSHHLKELSQCTQQLTILLPSKFNFDLQFQDESEQDNSSITEKLIVYQPNEDPIDHDLLLSLIKAYFPQIKELNVLVGCKYLDISSAKGLQCFQKLNKLNHAELKKKVTKDQNFDIIRVLKSCETSEFTQLQNLALNFNDKNCPINEFIKSYKKISNLQGLHLHFCQQINQERIIDHIPLMTNLKNLSFKFQNTDREHIFIILSKIAAILPSCNHIKMFMIEISEGIVQYFTEFCTIFKSQPYTRTEKLKIRIEYFNYIECLAMLNTIESFNNANVSFELHRNILYKKALFQSADCSINEEAHPVMANLLKSLQSLQNNDTKKQI